MLAPVSMQEAFSFFKNPHHLAKITPPWLNLQITTPEPITMRTGAEIAYVIRWLGLPLSWKTVIEDYNPPFYFVDVQAQGPYRLWRHRHEFRPREEGTLVCDDVEYALPYGLLGRLAHRAVVEKQLREIFRYRQEKLHERMLDLAGLAPSGKS
jgi:ligand-binding SRPBCC domain-containing protein